MKPLHFAVLAAVLAVGAVVYLMGRDAGERHRPRSSSGDGAGRAAEAGGGDAGADAEGSGAAGTDDDAAGTLFATLRVLGADGTPAQGVALELSGRLARSGATDGDGAARFDGLAAGLYTLLARRGRATGALDFELEESRDLGTLRLREAVAIRGRVLDASGAPVAGALVEAAVGEERGGLDLTKLAKVMMTPEAVVARDRTGEDGAYELLVARGGTFSVRASAPGMAQESEPPRRYVADVDGLDFRLFGGVGLSGRVVDERGAPVPGARVMLLEPLAILARRLPKVEQTTGEDGAFSLSVLPSDSLLLVVRATGFANQMRSDLALPQHDLTIVLGSGLTLRLRTVRASDPQIPAPHVQLAMTYEGNFAAGETDARGALVLENLPREGADAFGGQNQAFLWGGGFVAQALGLDAFEPKDGVLDLGEVAMEEGGIVRGRVVDAVTREPVPDADVRAMGGGDAPELAMMGAARAVSGEDGSFEIAGVPLDAAMVVATHEDYVSEANLLMMRMGGMGGPRRSDERIFAEGAREATVTVELQPAATIEGLVLSPEGEPLAGAEVQPQDPMALMSAFMGAGPQPATTDAEGRFVMKGLSPNQTMPLVATHREWGPSTPRKGRAGGEPVTIRLTEPILLKGVVVDEQGDPVPGVRVTAETGATGMMRQVQELRGGGARPTVTDREGRYTLRNAPPGPLEVRFEHPEYLEAKQSLTLPPYSEPRDLGRTVLQRGASLGGVVVDADGKPQRRIRVHVQLPEAVDAGDETPGRVWGQARTDDEGRFVVHGLREGAFRVEVRGSGLYGQAPLVDTGTMDVRLVVREAGELVGRVRDTRGQPVAGAQVGVAVPVDNARHQGETRHIGWARTDGEGRFRIDSLPPDRPVRVTFWHDEYRGKTQEGVLASPREQSFVLDPGLRVGGVVVDADGAPIARARVIVRVDGNHATSVQTDQEGRFLAGGLDQGTITAHVAESNLGLVPTEPVEVTAGDRSVRLVARKGASITGRVVDGAGDVVKGVSVVAYDADGRQVAQAWVWQDGPFELRGLPPGTYKVEASQLETDRRAVAQAVATGTDNLTITLPD